VDEQGARVFLSEWKLLDDGRRKFILACALFVVVVYALAIFFSIATLMNDKAVDRQYHQARMSTTTVEPGLTAPDPLPLQGQFTTVKMGSYIDSITNLSIRDSTWSAEFYVWFNWKGQKDLDPGGKLVLVNGSILQKQLLDDYHAEDGTNYQRYRIAARFQEFFNTALVPIERPMLNIYIEDGTRDGTMLRYVADNASNISSRARAAGYTVTGVASVVKPHTYRTSYGDPRKQENQRATFSQYVVGISLQKTSLGVYFKIFLCLYAALAIALANFFVKPIDVSPRFALPSASYFGVVANYFVVNAVLPPSNTFGLVDIVTSFGLGTIFITVALSLLSNYLYDQKGEPALALTLDRFMFYTVSLCCIVANVVIPLCAFL
jgi:hypothetical protein